MPLREGLWLVWNYRGQVPDLIALLTQHFKELAHKAILPGSLLMVCLLPYWTGLIHSCFISFDFHEEESAL